MNARITSDRFVGREAELAEMESTIGEAASGRPALVLVAGEAGVGKTRLIGEVERRLASAPQPPLILHGEAVPPDDGELPFEPLVGALRSLIRDRHPAVEELDASDRAQLATLWATLATSETPERGDRVDRLRLFESLRALIAAVCQSRPVVLVLEDGHWADASTLAFLDFLVRSMRDERLMVVFTYRTDEPDRGEAVRRLLAELHRHSRVRRIELTPFDPGELAEALTNILGQPPDPSVLSRLLERSDGNPLYAEELLAAGPDGRGSLPRSLSDAFQQRVERLSPAARRLTQAVAVGGSLEEPALATLTDLADDELAEALREALSAQIFVVDRADAFRFRHALLRETVYGELLPSRRAALHLALARHRERELAQAVEADREFGLGLQVAAHYLASGDQPLALRATLRAGELARHAQAYDRAADLLTESLELWPRLADAEAVAGASHADLLAEAGAMHARALRMDRACALLTAALDTLDADSEPRRCAEILFERAKAEQQLLRDQDATASVERALALIDDDNTDPLRQTIRSWSADQQIRLGRYVGARRELEALLATAVSTENHRLESDVVGMLGIVMMRLREPEAGLALMRQALELAREIGEEANRVEIAFNLALSLSRHGRQAESGDVLRHAIDATPASRALDRNRLMLQLAMVTFRAGDWPGSRDCLDSLVEHTGEYVARARLLLEAELAAGIGDLDRALACLQAGAKVAGSGPGRMFLAPYAALTAEVQARRGELPAAAEILENTVRQTSAYPAEALRATDVHAVAVRVHADRAQQARDLGDMEACEASVDRARWHLARLEAIEGSATVFERAQFAEARAHLRRARGTARGEDWASVAAAWATLEMPYPAAVAHLREAECHIGEEDRETATRVGSAALAVAQRLGSRWLAAELRGLARRARLSLSDGHGRRDTGVAVARPFDLTDRERQVLTRLAQGDTNRQIGEALFISEKTVSAHLSRIYAKLEVRGRTEAAALAHRHGLTVG